MSVSTTVRPGSNQYLMGSERVMTHRHREAPPGKTQNMFATLTVRTYVWIVPDWTLQQSLAKSTERRVRDVSYVGEPQSLPSYATCCT